MAKRVLIFDTSVLCCLLEVPGKETAGPPSDEWNKERITALVDAETKRSSTFVLPLATLVETGNHIAQASHSRFERATALAEHLLAASEGTTPWAAFTEQSLLWQSANLRRLAEVWPALAAKRISIGDATIKDVAEYYASAGFNVEILTGDQGLKAYEPVGTVPVPRRRK